jgi:hypothetical protein
VCLAAWTAPARADSIAPSSSWKYRLTNISSSPLTSPLDFSIIPPGSVTPPVRVGSDGQPVVDPTTGQPITDNPLIPVNSSGFDPASTFGAYDPKNLTVALGQNTPSGQPSTQTLLLLFGSKISQDANGQPVFTPILDANGNPVGGLDPGKSIDFRLNLPAGATTVPDLVPSAAISGLVSLEKVQAMTSRPPGSGPGGIPDPGSTNIPEPLSVLVWSGLASLGVMHARRRRRRAA